MSDPPRPKSEYMALQQQRQDTRRQRDQLRASVSTRARTIQLLNSTSQGIEGVTPHNRQQVLDSQTLDWFNTRIRLMDKALAVMEADGRPQLPDEPAQATGASSSTSVEAGHGPIPAPISPAKPRNVTCRTQEQMD